MVGDGSGDTAKQSMQAANSEKMLVTKSREIHKSVIEKVQLYYRKATHFDLPDS